MAHFEAIRAREVEESDESGEDDLIWEPSPLRHVDEPNVVNKIWWQAVEVYYALPPVDFRSVKREIRAECKRLVLDGTLQVPAHLPRKTKGTNTEDVESLYTSLEKLTAQRKVLETKLRILKFKRARLRGSANPSRVNGYPAAIDALWEKQQHLRCLNRRLAYMVNQALKVAKAKHDFFTCPPCQRKLPLKGAFRSFTPKTITLPTARYGEDPDWKQFVRIGTKGKGRPHRVQKPLSVKDWPVPPYVALSRW